MLWQLATKILHFCSRGSTHFHKIHFSKQGFQIARANVLHCCTKMCKSPGRAAYIQCDNPPCVLKRGFAKGLQRFCSQQTNQALATLAFPKKREIDKTTIDRVTNFLCSFYFVTYFSISVCTTIYFSWKIFRQNVDSAGSLETRQVGIVPRFMLLKEENSTLKHILWTIICLLPI